MISPIDIVDIIWERFISPFRWRSWKKKTAQFPHLTRLGKAFMLYPDELIDGYIYAVGAYDIRLLRYLRRVKGRTMLDIGANIGNHAINLANNFDRIICFEPGALIAQRLRDNIALNNLSNVEVRQVGLGRENAELPFFVCTEGNLGGSGFLPNGDTVGELAQIMLGDELGLTHIDFVKVDVEGLEADVFEGLAKTICRDRPLIVFEYAGTRGPQFHRIKGALPGYRFASFEGMRGGIVPIKNPEARFYDAIFAIPIGEEKRFGFSRHLIGGRGF